MKMIKRIFLLLVLLLIIGGVVVYFYIDRILRSTVESQASSSLQIPTTLDAAHLSLLGGNVSLTGLNIGSPKGYSANHMLELGGLAVGVKYGQLKQDPIHISSITIDKPHFVIEQQGGKMNFQAVMETQPPSTTPPPKVIIDELNLKDAVVDVNLGELPGGIKVPNVSVPIPTLQLKNIGNADGAGNGAAIKDVVMQVATALAGKASDSGAMGKQLQGFLQNNVKDMVGKLGGDFGKQLGSIAPNLGDLTKGLPGDLGKSVDDMTKKLPGGLGGLLGGDKKK